MDTSCRDRSNHGRPGAWEPFITMCWALSASGSVSDPIREASDRTALAPSDTDNSAMISNHSSRRAGPGSGGAPAHAAAGAGASSGVPMVAEPMSGGSGPPHT
jgi:hypothetical protein